MNIRFNTITVKDLDESLKFYKEVLGFIEIKRFNPMEEVTIAFLKDEDSGLIEFIEYKTLLRMMILENQLCQLV